MAETWWGAWQRRIGGWPRWWGQLLLGTWWLAMFIATHIPMPTKVGDSPVPDKLIHFVMFAVLGMLLQLWRGWSVPLSPRRAMQLFGLLVVYAVADELLQIPVGRSAEWLDGAADLAGGACGLLLAAGLWPTECVLQENATPVATDCPTAD